MMGSFEVCRDVPEPFRSDLKYSAAILQKESIPRTESMMDFFEVCRDVPRSCRDDNPGEKEKRLLGCQAKSPTFTVFTGIHLMS